MSKQMSIEAWKAHRVFQGDEDAARMTFLVKLDDSGLLPSPWEQDFIAGFLEAQSNYRGAIWWTDGRRVSCDKMRLKYAAELKLPQPLAYNEPKRKHAPIPEAVAGGCMYLVRDAGRLQGCCNEPAVCQTRKGFRYCQVHRDIAAVACQRKGTTLITEALK